MAESFEKKEYSDGDFHLQWFIWKELSKAECKGMPEWEEEGGAYCRPETKEEWKEAELYVTDGGEIDCKIEEFENWIWDVPITDELREYLIDVGYDLQVVITKDDEPIKVSKMGRKKIINVPNKNRKLKVGDRVRVTKVKKRERINLH